MYAERTAKGNVLEAEGLVEIKFRPKELEDWMLRLDPELIDLNTRLKRHEETKCQHLGNGDHTEEYDYSDEAVDAYLYSGCHTICRIA